MFVVFWVFVFVFVMLFGFGCFCVWFVVVLFRGLFVSLCFLYCVGGFLFLVLFL